MIVVPYKERLWSDFERYIIIYFNSYFDSYVFW